MISENINYEHKLTVMFCKLTAQPVGLLLKNGSKIDGRDTNCGNKTCNMITNSNIEIKVPINKDGISPVKPKQLKIILNNSVLTEKKT
jgi:hypothetical protein